MAIRADRKCGRRIQRDATAWSVRPYGPGGEPRGSHDAPRHLAYDARTGGRTPRSERPCPPPTRVACRGPASAPCQSPREGGRSTRRRASARAPRLVSGTHLEIEGAPPRPRGARPHPCSASRRLRRHVTSDLLAGAFFALRESAKQRGEPTCATARSIRGLRDLATRLVGG